MRIGLATPEDTLNLDMLEDDTPEEQRKPSGTYFITARHPGIEEDEIAAAFFDFGGLQETDEAQVLTGDVYRIGGYLKKCVVQITAFCLPVTGINGDERQQVWDPKNGGDNEDNRTIYLRLLDPALKVGPDEEALGDMLQGFLDAVAGRGTEIAEKHEEQKKRRG